jgi:hypothetical protein
MATLGGFELMIFPTSPCTSLLIRSGTAGDFSRLAGNLAAEQRCLVKIKVCSCGPLRKTADTTDYPK